MTAAGATTCGSIPWRVQRADAGQLGQQDAGHRRSGCIQHLGGRQYGGVLVVGGLRRGKDVGPRERRERHADAGELAEDRRDAVLGL